MRRTPSPNSFFPCANSYENLSPAVKLINSVFRTLKYQRMWLSKSSSIVVPSVDLSSYSQFKRFLKNTKTKVKIRVAYASVKWNTG